MNNRRRGANGVRRSGFDSNRSGIAGDDSPVQSYDVSDPDPPASPYDNHGYPVDPNEPTYCVCGQVSFGEMIACDNEECSIKWFHIDCIGLKSLPKGKWYCPECTNTRKRAQAANR